MNNATHILYPLPDGSETSLVFDAVVRETHTDASTVTESPVEDGANVADHVRAELPRLVLEAVVSSTPILVPSSNMEGVNGDVRSLDLGDGNGTATVLQFDDLPPRVRSIYALLLQLKTAATLVRVALEIREYENMVIESVEINRDTPVGSTTFLISIRGIRIVTSETIAADPAPHRGNRQRHRGTQPTETPEHTPTHESFAHRLSRAITPT